ncbi:CtsR family transcriptional regulator [Lacticigenium naphthae]|uniref:CtsR family transcriptional regulator n=1 Tax=Lacticigenium naphthae TaxID=515351 RepID=UPI0003F4CB56|nr:CtsR family transcriptional regulator [Lacticigenium naphthae]
MQNHNMSDIIEAYLKKVLNRQEQIEIRRNEIAALFDCVPSQINYVINTRFTIQHGYLVESKRGGGGYIRIIKVQLLDESEFLDTMIEIIGESISQKDSQSIVTKLFEDQLITRREAKLILIAIDKSYYTMDNKAEKNMRARLMKSFLTNLKYEDPNEYGGE